MTRRHFLLLAVLVGAADSRASAGGIAVVYLGTHDCFYCQHWEAARKPELLAMLRGRPASLVEVRGETLAEPIVERHFPAEYRWVYRAVGEVRGVPRFLLLVDGRIVLRVHGTSDYSELVVPRLRAELARKR